MQTVVAKKTGDTDYLSSTNHLKSTSYNSVYNIMYIHQNGKRNDLSWGNACVGNSYLAIYHSIQLLLWDVQWLVQRKNTNPCEKDSGL